MYHGGHARTIWRSVLSARDTQSLYPNVAECQWISNHKHLWSARRSESMEDRVAYHARGGLFGANRTNMKLAAIQYTDDSCLHPSWMQIMMRLNGRLCPCWNRVVLLRFDCRLKLLWLEVQGLSGTKQIKHLVVWVMATS